MAQLQLTAEVRSNFKKSHTKSLRREGIVPATVYGKQIGDSVSIQVTLDDLRRCLQTDAGLNAIMDLSIKDNGEDRQVPVMVHEVQRDPRTRQILNVDFRTISMDQVITTSVPVHLIGDAVGVREGGMADHIQRELTVRALPGNIPPHIDLDISGLGIGDSIKIGDVQVEGVEIEGLPDEPIVLVRIPTVAPLEEEIPEEEAEAEEEEAESQEPAAEAESAAE